MTRTHFKVLAVRKKRMDWIWMDIWGIHFSGHSIPFLPCFPLTPQTATQLDHILLSSCRISFIESELSVCSWLLLRADTRNNHMKTRAVPAVNVPGEALSITLLESLSNALGSYCLFECSTREQFVSLEKKWETFLFHPPQKGVIQSTSLFALVAKKLRA